MVLKKLSKKAKNYWVVTNLIFVIIILSVANIAIFSVQNELLVVMAISVGVPAVLLSAWIIIYQFLKYHFYKYNYNEQKIFISYGVIFRHKVVIPICQIQDLHVYEGPIMTLFKLRGVILSTAGSNFEIRCLDRDVASTIVSDVEGFLRKRVEELKNEKI